MNGHHYQVVDYLKPGDVLTCTLVKRYENSQNEASTTTSTNTFKIPGWFGSFRFPKPGAFDMSFRFPADSVLIFIFAFIIFIVILPTLVFQVFVLIKIFSDMRDVTRGFPVRRRHLIIRR